MNIAKSILVWLSSSRNEEEKSCLFAQDGEQVYWNFSRPLLLFGLSNYLPHEEEAPQVVCFRLENGCGYFEVCGEELFNAPKDGVKLFDPEQPTRKLVHQLRFLWSGDGSRVLFELDGEPVAAADFARKRMIAREPQPPHSHSRRWSGEGYRWDESLLDDFDTVPDGMPPCRPRGWWDTPALSFGKRVYCVLLFHYWLFSIPLALLLIYREVFTPWQGLFFYFWLRIVRRMVETAYRNPYQLVLRAHVPEARFPSNESLWRDTPFPRQLLMLGVCTAALLGLLRFWFAGVLLFWLFCYPVFALLLLVIGIQPPGVRRRRKRLEEEIRKPNAEQFGIMGGVAGLVLGRFLAEQYAGKKVVLGLSRQQLAGPREEEKDDDSPWLLPEPPDLLLGPIELETGDGKVELQKIADGFGAAGLDAAFGTYPDAGCLLSLHARFDDWKRTELWQTHSGNIFLYRLDPVDYREAFREIQAGRLAGALIPLGSIPRLDWAALNPEPFQDLDKWNKEKLLAVHQSNVNALIHALVEASHTVFAPLQEM